MASRVRGGSPGVVTEWCRTVQLPRPFLATGCANLLHFCNPQYGDRSSIRLVPRRPRPIHASDFEGQSARYVPRIPFADVTVHCSLAAVLNTSRVTPWLISVLRTSLLVLVIASALLTGFPGAAGAHPQGTSCTRFAGPFPEGPFTLSGCSDTSNTGGSGSLDNRTGVVTWVAGRTTTVAYALTPVKHDEREKQGCPPTSAAEFKLRGTVTADTTGSIEVGGPVTGEVCGRENGVLTNERGTRLKIV
jgi:hypothetical protein